MHFLLQRRARCGRRCIGAGEELIRAFLASPFSLPRCHGSPSSLPIYLPSVVSLFLYLFFSRRNFLIFKFETFIRIIIVFICQLVISLSLLSLSPPPPHLHSSRMSPKMRRGKRIAPILLLDSISHSSLVTDEGRPQNCALLNHYTHWINYYEKTNVVLQYFIYLWEKTQKANFSGERRLSIIVRRLFR